jgi:hypothetical protein
MNVAINDDDPVVRIPQEKILMPWKVYEPEPGIQGQASTSANRKLWQLEWRYHKLRTSA